MKLRFRLRFDRLDRRWAGATIADRRVRMRSQAGFTAPELLIAAFLVAASAGLISTAIYQVFVVSQDGNSRLSVLSDLENAALWIGRDATEAVSWTPGTGRQYGTFATSDSTVSYRYLYDSGEGALVRQVLVSGTPQNSIRIARHIDQFSDVSFGSSGSLMDVSITATSGGSSESTTLYLTMRAR